METSSFISLGFHLHPLPCPPNMYTYACWWAKALLWILNFNALKSFCFVFFPKPYKLCLPCLHINNMPLVYVDSIKYLGFTFSRNHKDDDRGAKLGKIQGGLQI